MASNLNKIALLKKHIRAYQDFPKPGIIFRDIFSAMLNVDSFKALRELLIDRVKNIDKKVDAIVGLESRGFLLGPILALEFSLPFVPVRKKGKLPGPVSSVAYTLEYSTDVFEVQKESLKAGKAVLIVDDLLATGGYYVIEEVWPVNIEIRTKSKYGVLFSLGKGLIIPSETVIAFRSLKAACDLMASVKVDVVECLVVMELTELKGRDIISAPVYSLIQY